MLSPILPVRLGEKGPPYIKEWQTESLGNLAFANKKFAHSNKGLRLDSYLVLDPDDKPAADILDRMDQKGELPPRYHGSLGGDEDSGLPAPPGLQPVKPMQSPKLELRTGMGQYVLVPPASSEISLSVD